MTTAIDHSTALAGLFGQLMPEMILGAAACVLFLGGTWLTNRALWAGVTLAALIGAGCLSWPTTSASAAPSDTHNLSFLGASTVGSMASPMADGTLLATSAHVARTQAYELQTYGTPLVFDSLTSLIRWIALGAGILLTLFGWSEVPRRQASDFFACLLVIVAGTSLTAAANDLVVLFLALELVSIPTYVLLYLPRHDDQAQEAAMKYFFISIFSSALMLFGFSYLYGLAGTTNLPALHNALNAVDANKVPVQVPLLSQVALIMIVAGLGFRITAVPFHFYAPERLSGNGDGRGGVLAVIPKVVGFVALVRLLGFVLPYGLSPRNGLVGIGVSEHVPALLWFLAAVTMSLGNLLALLQNNVKRLLAYSSIAHGGYMLMALATTPFLPHDNLTLPGPSVLFFYLVAYGVMTIGAFALVSYFEGPRRAEHRKVPDGAHSPAPHGARLASVDDLAGLGTSHPWPALLMTIFLFSLIGIPLTAGFAGKFLIFFGAMAVASPEHALIYRVLAVIGVVNAAIGGWYYLRIVAVMYLRNPLEPLESCKTWPGLVLLGLCAAATIGFGIPPGVDWLVRTTHEATRMLR